MLEQVLQVIGVPPTKREKRTLNQTSRKFRMLWNSGLSCSSAVGDPTFNLIKKR
ncbi:hypothetical protein [Priestia megaterium]|uniref:hypothetical protein n=1 Tax=Priestia megaterium TaxID=1404 RepID=UPI00366E195A